MERADGRALRAAAHVLHPVRHVAGCLNQILHCMRSPLRTFCTTGTALWGSGRATSGNRRCEPALRPAPSSQKTRRLKLPQTTESVT